MRWVLLPTLGLLVTLYATGKLADRIVTADVMTRLFALRGMGLPGRLLGKLYQGLTGLGFSLFLALFTTILFLKQIEFFHFVRISLGNDHFSALYQQPDLHVLATRSAKKNLLLIYVESLERTMGNAALVGRDTLAPLKQLEGTEIPSFPAAPGTNWTIAGMFSKIGRAHV